MKSASRLILPLLPVLLCGAACTTPGSGTVADRWELKGPFRRLQRSEPPADRPAARERTATTQPATRPVAGMNTTGFDTASIPDGFTLRPEPDERAAATDDYQAARPDAERRHRLFAPVAETEDRFWYLDLGFRMGVTKLRSAKHRLDRRLDLPLKLDFLNVFESPQTPIDRKSDLALTTAYIGVGRRETEWLTWNFYFGSGVGGDRDHQRWLNANLDVNFDYAVYYTGLTVDVYPWGLSQRGRFESLAEHFRASRPYMVTGFELGYVRARGWGRFALAPVEIYNDSQRIEDWLFSYLVGFGWEFPIDHRWAFNLQAHYTFHVYRPEEYNGWNITYALRYQF